MNEPTLPPTATDRRKLLRGAGLAGLTGLGTFALSAAPAHAAPSGVDNSKHRAVPVVGPEDDLAAALAATPQVQLLHGTVYTLNSTVQLPAGTLIEGNGATITVANDSLTALHARQVSDVTLRNIRFQGRAQDPTNTAPEFGHVAVRLERSTNVRVLDCTFEFWRGAGVAVTGSTADDYFSYRSHISGNNFHRCYFGVSLADRSEYSLLTGNIFSTNRLAIWHSSGNWTVSSNITVNCYGAYYSFAKSSPYGALTSDNWNHGSVTGNTFNHSNGSGGARWTEGTSFPIGGTAQDPGTGVVVDGLLPPTFTGNTVWYSNIKGNNVGGTPWLLTGNTLSNLSISCTGNNWIHLLGFQSNGTANTPRLSGNVKNLLPA